MQWDLVYKLYLAQKMKLADDALDPDVKKGQNPEILFQSF